MTDPHPNPFPRSTDPLDQLIRDSLDTESTRTDVSSILQAALNRLDLETAPRPVAETPSRHFWRRVSAVVAFSAAVFLGIFFLQPGQQASASPAEVLTAARELSSRETDRCYQIRLSAPPGWANRIERFLGERQALYTRGPQFYQKFANDRGVWGRDADGRIWLAPTPEAAAIFESNELPRALQEVVLVHGLELPRLLDDVLGDFHLEWSKGRPESRTILARRQRPAGPLQLMEAELVLLADSDVIRQMTLVRALPMGNSVQITLSLIDSPSQPEDAFTPRFYLAPEAPIYGPDRPLLRRRVVVQHLGEALLNGN